MVKQALAFTAKWKMAFVNSSAFQHLTHGAEIAGLGTLAIPSAQKFRKIHAKTTTQEEKSTAKKELAGLGILALPSALHLGHAAYSKFKGR